ncbi:MAG: SUMF1/EgtB/PvdO family nonheme iron enzyme [Myxococcales bacterium]|nr:SUMF1/EgtB/PvdO family nonheme iron enzyme [Myxococcales bacterium]
MTRPIAFVLGGVVVLAIGGVLTLLPSRKRIAPTGVRTPSPMQVSTVPLAVAMLRVPAGYFAMGCDPRQDRYCRGKGTRRVWVHAFFIDRTEVTQQQYDRCVAVGSCRVPARFFATTRAPRQPVRGVTWFQARAFCHWAGKRLPSEAEWEKAARGTDGRTYPWGNEAPTCELANFSVACGGRPRSVGSAPRGVSPYGLLDATGNVEEWVADWYAETPTGERDPKGPPSGTERVVRGGGYDHDPWHSRVAFRFWQVPTHVGATIGFRCAADRDVRELPRH